MFWTDVRLKYLCVDSGQYGLNVSSENYMESGVRLLRTTDISTGTLTPDEEGVFVSAPLEERFKLHEGDLLLSRSGTPPGQSYLVRAKDADATFAGYLVRFRPTSKTEPRFLAYAARSAPFQHVIRAESVASTIQNFNAERYANIVIPVPEQEEQRRIADFLDFETARLKHLLERDARLTHLLTERRQATIDHEVHAPSRRRVKLFWRLATLRDGTHQPPPRVAQGVPLLTARNVSSGTLSLTEMDTHVSHADADVLERSLCLTPGDILLSVKGTIGACAVAPRGFPRAVLDRNVALLRPLAGHSSEWLAWVLRSTNLQEQMRIAVTATAQPGLPLGVIRELRVPDVPEAEQSERAAHIVGKVREIDEVLVRMQRKNSLLTERRQALITAAVTGQFDVSTASGRNVTDGVTA
ncbi:restriction endonuclease subunit S [Streptomyces diastatochromogenes]|uniref:restriction endonuclease subunit S n=1 Tax=Streptomyces diastatochromogenes TaxID=42236 RepID=UPI0036C73C82